ncbi:lipoprotein, partial [Candidatus Endoriftia persephone str. Guaymas]|nr:lipoprotein [Candidatus Endoriftia persephone str. Guaymas]
MRPLFWPVLLLALTCCSIGPSIIEQDIDGISSSIPAPSDINAIPDAVPDAVPKKEPRSRYGNAPSYV